jgi:hypothetical protein
MKMCLLKKFCRGGVTPLVLILIGLAAAQSSLAQSFGAPVEYQVGTNPYAVAVGDLNGDGKLDLAVANNSTSNVSVLLGNGDTTFGARTDYAVGANAYGIVLTDLNGDGKLDIATANSFSSTTNVSVLLGNGNGTFQAKVDYAFGGLAPPNSLSTADFNGDHKPDLVAVNGSAATVFLGNGDGTLKAPVSYGGSNFATCVAVEDFNGDGKPDLALTSYGSASGIVSIMLGKGDGTFFAPVDYSAGPSPFAVTVGDYNGDGKVDIATADTQVDQISVLLGIGDGTFQPKVNYPTGSSPYGIATADFNNDGKRDIVVAGNGFGLAVSYGNGDGTFRAPAIFQAGGVFATVVDLNADTKPDLISGAQLNAIAVLLNQTGPYNLNGTIKDGNGVTMSGVSVFLSGGTGETATTDASGLYAFHDLTAGGNYSVQPLKTNYTFAPSSQSFPNLSSNVTADFTGTLLNYSISGKVRDNFGNPMNNVTMTLTGTRTATVTTAADGGYSFLNLPGGGNYVVTPSLSKFMFSGPFVTINNLSSNRVVNFTGSIASFTISGVVNDVVNNTSIDNLWMTLTGTKSGTTFTSSFGYAFSGLPIDGNYSVNAFAASGSSLFTNFLVLPPSSQTFNGLTSNMTANFSARRLNFSTGNLNPDGIARGDLNGDGKPDLVVATTTGSNIHVLIGNGDGTFKPEVPYLSDGNPFAVVIADFDGDGKADVAAANYSGSNVSILIGNGDGTLKSRVNYGVAGSPSRLAAGDVNGDSKTDLVVLSSGNNVNVLLGNGDGTFKPSITKNVPTAVGSVSIGELNGDNKPDLIVPGFSNGILVLRGNGDGTFANAVSYPAGSDLRRASVADLNGDGKLDVAVANFKAFTILLGNGDGTFQTGITTSLSTDPVDVIIGEFDGDNRADLVIGNYSGGIFFASGNGDGTFKPLAVYAAGSYTGSVVGGDLNGDGRADLAITSQGDSTVSVLLNASLTRLPGIQFDSSTLNINESAGNAVVTVTRSTGVSSAVTVGYATSDQAGAQNCNVTNHLASSRCDYANTQGILTFAAGETSKTISIPIVDDSYAEGNESFSIVLSNPIGAKLDSPNTITVNVIDNDGGASGPNPADQASFFVRQNYLDFLNRDPDASGLAFWTDQITSCGGDVICTDVKRTNVSAAFFLSIEFQDTGYLVERLYKAAYGGATGTSTFGGTHQFTVPIVRFNEFLPDTQTIGRGVIVGQTGWEQALEINKQAFAADFAQRARFLTAFPPSMAPAQFVDKLNENAGSPLSQTERDQLVNDLLTNAKTRAQALRVVAEDSDLKTAEFNRAFVLMQFFGYLRRNPNDAPDSDYTGYDFWLTKLNQFNGNFQNADMVKAFITSSEYRQRFGP